MVIKLMPAGWLLRADIASQDAARWMRYWPLLVLVLLTPIWSIGLFDREAWTPDEPREYDVAHNMLRSGDLVTPQLAGKPFLEKPPLLYWLQSGSMRLLGPSITAARLPNLILAALAVLCIGALARDMAPERNRNQAALIAALAGGTMGIVLQVQIWLATDAPLVAMTAASLLSSWRLARAKTLQQQLQWSLLLGASLAGAFLAKNGFGLVVPALTIIGWLAWERRLRELLHWRWWAAAAWLALFAGSWLIALARQPGGRELLHALLWDNLVARFLPVQSSAGYDLGHRSSHYEYLLLLPVYVLPWTCALFAAARWSISASRSASELRSAVRFCVAAVVPACIVLLLSRTARGVYFAPALLGLPVLLALWLTTRSDKLTTSEQTLLRLTRLTMQTLAVLFAAVAMLLIWLAGASEISPGGAAALIAFVLAGTLLYLYPSAGAVQGIVTTIGMFLVAFGTVAVLAFPIIDRAERLDTVVAAAEPRLKQSRVALYCGDETIRATLDYTIDQRLEDVCGTEDAERLLQAHGDQQFLVLLPPPRTAERMQELFPSLDTSKWKAKQPRTVKRISDLTGLGLQETARWSSPGGRKYALYGRITSDIPAA